MRQRIKAVETIKKITHAMRLISMSSHSRLRTKKVFLEKYKDAFLDIYQKVRAYSPKIQNEKYHSSKELYIVIGSQKGLCGTFNTKLQKYLESRIQPNVSNVDVVAVGKQAQSFLTQYPVIAHFDTFNIQNFVHIAHQLNTIISQGAYKKVVVFSNILKNFFMQKPEDTTIFPYNIPLKQPLRSENIVFENPKLLLEKIETFLISIQLQELLFESLLAEQAARFISMDTATHNADDLLIQMKLSYNKLRQAAITRELTELSSSF